MKLTEAQFTQQVKELFEKLGWLVYHTKDSRYSQAGFPDIVAVRKPRVVFAELKIGNKLTQGHIVRGKQRNHWVPGQQEWIEELLGCPGIESYVWKPEDWDNIVPVAEKR